MDAYYLNSSDSDEEIVKSKKETKVKEGLSLEDEFDQLIESKIRGEHNIKLNANKFTEDLYDPDKDDEDEEFVQSLNISNKFSNSNENKSDATLNCPCCTSLLSLDCQRHVIYKNQYRAMFTFNCRIDKEKPVDQPSKSAKKRRKNKNNQSTSLETKNDEILYPVLCEVCSTEVGVYDNDEIYHFYNILASY